MDSQSLPLFCHQQEEKYVQSQIGIPAPLQNKGGGGGGGGVTETPVNCRSIGGKNVSSFLVIKKIMEYLHTVHFNHIKHISGC